MSKPVSELGYSVSVMMHGVDVDILDNYVLEKGYLERNVFELSHTQRWFHTLLVRARKQALHEILSQYDTANIGKSAQTSDPEK